MDNKMVLCARESIYNPEYKTSGSAGGDLRAYYRYTLAPHETIKLSTGLKVKLPDGYAMIIKPRSSTAIKKGVLVIEGVIDSDYTGEISIVAHNLTDDYVTIDKEERIAQAVIVKLAEYEVEYCNEYDTFSDVYKTERGEGGFGSTGSF